MNAINHADEILDALGMQCPEPVVHARNRLADMAPGRVLEVLVDDPLAELDFTVFCRRAGHELLGIVTRDAVWHIRIRRRQGRQPAPGSPANNPPGKRFRPG